MRTPAVTPSNSREPATEWQDYITPESGNSATGINKKEAPAW
jgi:hypothetical protein